MFTPTFPTEDIKLYIITSNRPYRITEWCSPLVVIGGTIFIQIRNFLLAIIMFDSNNYRYRKHTLVLVQEIGYLLSFLSCVSVAVGSLNLSVKLCYQ